MAHLVARFILRYGAVVSRRVIRPVRALTAYVAMSTGLSRLPAYKAIAFVLVFGFLMFTSSLSPQTEAYNLIDSPADQPYFTNYVDLEGYVSKGRSSTRDRSELVYHFVEAGETLSGIAAEYDITSTTLKRANDVQGALQPGMQLRVPYDDGIFHEVKSGDTLTSLAKKYHAQENLIKWFNDLDETGLMAGEEVFILHGTLASDRARRSYSVSTGRSTIPPGPNAPDLGGNRLAKPMRSYVWIRGVFPGHNGVDLAGPFGTPIYAAESGTIIEAKASGYNGGFGRTILIDHGGGLETRYAHLQALSVSKGQTVSRGQHIGTVGSSGRSTGPHLHYEVHDPGIVDPTKYW